MEPQQQSEPPPSQTINVKRATSPVTWGLITIVLLLFGSFAVICARASENVADETSISTGVMVSGPILGKGWPLTVSAGEIDCVDGSSVIFTGPDDKVYSLNDIAISTGKYTPIDPIWANMSSARGQKKDLSPLIDIGLDQCAAPDA